MRLFFLLYFHFHFEKDPCACPTNHSLPCFLRYIVAKELPYNETADVYSLSMMAWQIFAMQVPFSGYSISMHNTIVVEKGGRPKVDPKWGEKLGEWMGKAWSPKIPLRPSMKKTSQVFREEVNKYEDEIEDFSNIDVSSRTAKSA